MRAENHGGVFEVAERRTIIAHGKTVGNIAQRNSSPDRAAENLWTDLTLFLRRIISRKNWSDFIQDFFPYFFGLHIEMLKKLCGRTFVLV
jgi:hypothetical protein